MKALELKFPPLALSILFAAAMWGTALYTPAFSVAIHGRTGFAVALFAIGVAFSLAGLYEFLKARTTFNPTRPESSSAFVRSGIYRVSRNPMYVGFLLALSGWAFFLGHALSFAFLPVFAAYIHRFQIVPEERVLSVRFGSEYLTYMKSVRRWL